MGSRAGRPVKALICSPVGPDETNSRPARPSSVHFTRDAELPVLSGAVGCGRCGSSKASYSRKDKSSERKTVRMRRLLAIDQNSRTAASTDTTFATRLGTKRRMYEAKKLITSRENRASTKR